tara:strand:- start:693 stop:935 length:243 start_codon:yes stop_codon:yes gene_type:complete
MQYKLLILDTNGMYGKTYEISNKIKEGEGISHADFITEQLNEDWFGDELITEWVDQDFNDGKPLMYPRHKDFKFTLYKQV